MIDERADRLSIFRVLPVYFQKMDKYREELRAWGDALGMGEKKVEPPPMILVGDQVESKVFPANLRREVYSPLYSSAKVIKVRNDGLFDLQSFNGMVQKGVEQENITGPHGIGIFI